MLPGASTAAAATAIANFTAPSITNPRGITSGPDGNLWFTNSAGNTIGRVSTAGTVDAFSGTGVDNPQGITTGPDGNLWFTNFGNSSIGRITPTGTVSNFTDVGINSPLGITSGPDGNLWFTNVGNNSIGRITPAGTVSSFAATGIGLPIGITAGPDGNLWFTNNSTGSIGRITPAGVVSTFADPDISNPRGITNGPDGSLWFTNAGNNSIGRVTTSGVVSTFFGSGVSYPSGIVAGDDGNLWFTNTANDSIGRISPTGTVANFTAPTVSGPVGVAAGSDGNLWFTNALNNSIGRISTITGSFFHPLTPTRILDSRGATGGWSSPLTAGSPKVLTVIGGTNAVPADAEAVVLNVTVTGGSANSFLTVYPAGGAVPNVSNLNFAAGQTTPNLVTVKVGANGQVSFANESGSVHVIADIAGYYSPGTADRYNPIAPTRILDSRGSTGGWNAPLVATAPRTLQVTGIGGVPATADAVVLNVTVTGGSANSFLTVYPSSASVPNVSNLNFAVGETVPNLVTVKLGADGKVSFANALGSVNVIADVAGYYDPSTGDVFHPLAPARILDSRGATGGWNAKLAAGTPRNLAVVGAGGVPSDATAVIANATVTAGSANSFLTVYPAGDPHPTASNVNYAVGQTVPNLTAVKLGSGGQLTFETEVGSTDVIFDVAGYFSPT